MWEVFLWPLQKSKKKRKRKKKKTETDEELVTSDEQKEFKITIVGPSEVTNWKCMQNIHPKQQQQQQQRTPELTAGWWRQHKRAARLPSKRCSAARQSRKESCRAWSSWVELCGTSSISPPAVWCRLGQSAGSEGWREWEDEEGSGWVGVSECKWTNKSN